VDLSKKYNDPVEKMVLRYMESIYLNELYWLLSNIKSKCEELFQKAKVPEKGYVIQVDMQVHSIIKSIVSDSSQVSYLIEPRSPAKNEMEQKYVFRKERGEFLKNIFKDIEIKEMTDRKLRDSIEHFDERLDNLVHTIAKKSRTKSRTLAYNIVLSEKSALQPFPLPIRVYISAEKKFYNMNWSIDLGKIYDECTHMLSAISELDQMRKASDPGGLLVYIPRIVNDIWRTS
jgi:hypothetical protein